MERGSAPADGMASYRGIVVALVGLEPTTPPYKRVALTAGLQSHVAGLSRLSCCRFCLCIKFRKRAVALCPYSHPVSQCVGG